MALYLVATPIGNDLDISSRALEILRSSSVIILEEFKESTRFLRAQGITGKIYEQLNEHSTPDDIQKLADLCREKDIPLITDCGTPGFCDPGAALVRECRRRGIPVQTLPGPSSLMALLSLSSERLDQFVFRGFLPAENSAREKAWLEVAREKRALILMDTPYRFQKTLEEIRKHFPKRKILLALNLTSPAEKIVETRGEHLPDSGLPAKAEFMVLVYPA